MIVDSEDGETIRLVNHFLARLSLPGTDLRVTTNRTTFERWLGRRVSSALGGAYAYLPGERSHVVLINLPRIDRSRPKAVAIVVAEELIHMRDQLDGDRRRHAKHGYDRIAWRVASLTDCTLEEVRLCLIPSVQRPYRYLYVCPQCGQRVRRRRRGVWSCGRCAPAFDARFELRLVADLTERPRDHGADDGT